MNDAEIKYIQTGGGFADRSALAAAEKFQWADLLKVLSYRKLWGIYIGQIAVNSTIWFFLTWFPTYLVKYRHMDFIKAGFLASLPFLAAFCGILIFRLCLGFHDAARLVRHHRAKNSRHLRPAVMHEHRRRELRGQSRPDHLFLSIAGFGSGMSSIAWVFVSALAPKRLLGLDRRHVQFHRQSRHHHRAAGHRAGGDGRQLHARIIFRGVARHDRRALLHLRRRAGGTR
jgi:ACS family D-galactonate transporter-like MFS transporter